MLGLNVKLNFGAAVFAWFTDCLVASVSDVVFAFVETGRLKGFKLVEEPKMNFGRGGAPGSSLSSPSSLFLAVLLSSFSFKSFPVALVETHRRLALRI